MARRLADPQVVGALRAELDQRVGRGNAIQLRPLASLLGCHPRRVSEAAAFLAADHYPIASVAGVGFWRIASEEERQAAIRPEARRLVSIAARLEGLGWRQAAADIRQLALGLTGRAA